MIEGHFIVLEGVDGAGTTTHAQRLATELSRMGLPVHVTREPSDGPMGLLLRQILTGRVVVPGIHGSRPSSWNTMALLFAADRLDHLESEILPNLMDGVTVICDRYDYSSLSYQSVAAGGENDAIRWILDVNRFARRPDLTLVLDVPPEVAAKRRQIRGGAGSIYDDQELQREIGDAYRNVEVHYPNDNVVHVDSNRTLEAVASDILAHVRKLRGDAPLGG